MSDLKWTDERVTEFARVYCGNPTEGFKAEDFHGLKMEEKMRLFKEQVALMEQMRKDVIVSASTESLRDELSRRGYAVDALWRSDDVFNEDPSGSLTDDEALEIMNRVSRRDGLVEMIHEMIQDEVTDYKNQDQ